MFLFNNANNALSKSTEPEVRLPIFDWFVCCASVVNQISQASEITSDCSKCE